MKQLQDAPRPNTPDLWEEMKPHIEQLWLMKRLKLPLVVSAMKTMYGFDAV
jgi:hypothetical protein